MNSVSPTLLCAKSLHLKEKAESGEGGGGIHCCFFKLLPPLFSYQMRSITDQIEPLSFSNL